MNWQSAQKLFEEQKLTVLKWSGDFNKVTIRTKDKDIEIATTGSKEEVVESLMLAGLYTPASKRAKNQMKTLLAKKAAATPQS